MFALGFWNETSRTLTLARDRMGKKPLYYGWGDSSFLFSLELKSFRVIPAFLNVLCLATQSLLLNSGYIPHSIYKNSYKLPCGSFIVLSEADLRHKPKFFLSVYGESETRRDEIPSTLLVT